MADAYAASTRADDVADWVELVCLQRRRSMGFAALRDEGKSAGYGDTDIDIAVRTTARRAAVLGDAYPFVTRSGMALVKQRIGAPWVALLLMSPRSPVRALPAINAAAGHLEDVTSAALLHLYGPQTRSLRFAWPSADGRPQVFRDAVHWLAGQMGIAAGDAYRPPHTKDGGVDVVTWRPFPDGRSGFPVMLTQCTIQKEFQSKVHDIDTRVWSGHLRLDFEPVTALAVPHVIGAGEEWNRLSTRTVLIDRLRLCTLIGTAWASSTRLAASRAWADDVLTELQVGA